MANNQSTSAMKRDDILRSLREAVDFEKKLLNNEIALKVSRDKLGESLQQSLREIIGSSGYEDPKTLIFAIYSSKNYDAFLLGYAVHCPQYNSKTFFFTNDGTLLFIQKVLLERIIKPIDWLYCNNNANAASSLEKEWQDRLRFENFTIKNLNSLEVKLSEFIKANPNNQFFKGYLATLKMQNMPTIERLTEAKALLESIASDIVSKSFSQIYTTILNMLEPQESASKIVRINWGVYNRCPLACKGCYNIFNADILPLEECMAIIDKLVEAGVKELIISGGDPLLWPQIHKFCQYASQRGLLLGVDTVSYNLDNKLAYQLKNWISYIGIPLDGYNQETIETFRLGKKDLFHKTITSLEIANTAHIPIRLNTTLYKENQMCLEHIALIAIRYKMIKSWSIYQWWSLRSNHQLKSNMALSSEVFEKTVVALQDKFPMLNIMPRMVDNRARRAFFISSNGEVYTFGNNEQIATIIIGDIKVQSIEDIAKSPALIKDSKFKPSNRFYN